ncbi:MAG: hypothetical protein N2C12_09915, partial [Planctomycetales bacterium]
LQPAGLSQVQIQLPEPEDKILHARVGGLTAIPVQVDGKWSVPLSSELLPQRIEVVYEARFARQAGQLVATAPILSTDGNPITTVKTLWTIAVPGIASASRRQHEDARNNQIVQQQITRTARMLDLVSNVTSAEPVDVLAPWYHRWIQRLSKAHNELLVSCSGINVSPSVTEQLKQIEARFRQLRDQLIIQGIYPSKEAFNASVDSTPSAWDWSFVPAGTINHDIQDGAQPRFVVGQRDSQWENELTRYGLAFFLGTSAVVIGIKRWQPWRRLRQLSICEIAFFIALFSWLFLNPSLFGFAAMLLVIVIALRAGWVRSRPNT